MSMAAGRPGIIRLSAVDRERHQALLQLILLCSNRPHNRPIETDSASGITQVSAGSQASAVVTGDGQLWQWGRLLSADNARALVAQHGEPAGLASKLDQWASWPGMGTNQPQPVPGLPPLSSVHLGAAHALAVAA